MSNVKNNFSVLNTYNNTKCGDKLSSRNQKGQKNATKVQHYRKGCCKYVSACNNNKITACTKLSTIVKTIMKTNFKELQKV